MVAEKFGQLHIIIAVGVSEKHGITTRDQTSHYVANDLLLTPVIKHANKAEKFYKCHKVRMVKLTLEHQTAICVYVSLFTLQPDDCIDIVASYHCLNRNCQCCIIHFALCRSLEAQDHRRISKQCSQAPSTFVGWGVRFVGNHTYTFPLTQWQIQKFRKGGSATGARSAPENFLGCHAYFPLR